MTERSKCINLMYEIYPLSRKIVFDTFDLGKNDLTRTQQIIIMALSIHPTLSMSQLAKKINTSNEQATRAVAQLVEKGFISRCKSQTNKRVINISLTEKAHAFLKKTKDNIHDELVKKFDIISDEEIHRFYESLIQIKQVLRIVEK